MASTRTLKRIAPLSAGKLGGALYFALGLVFTPFLAIPMLITAATGHASNGMPFSGALLLAMPFLYGLMGFVFSCLFAALYNVFAALIGGLQIVVSDASDEQRT